MELYQAEDNYIIQDKDSSLWCSRVDGKLVPQPGKVMSEAREMHCIASAVGLAVAVSVQWQSFVQAICRCDCDGKLDPRL